MCLLTRRRRVESDSGSHGRERPDKEAKVATARTLWVPAVNNHGGFGRWAFVETDPWDAKAPITEAALASGGLS